MESVAGTENQGHSLKHQYCWEEKHESEWAESKGKTSQDLAALGFKNQQQQNRKLQYLGTHLWRAQTVVAYRNKASFSIIPDIHRENSFWIWLSLILKAEIKIHRLNISFETKLLSKFVGGRFCIHNSKTYPDFVSNTTKIWGRQVKILKTEACPQVQSTTRQYLNFSDWKLNDKSSRTKRKFKCRIT